LETVVSPIKATMDLFLCNMGTRADRKFNREGIK